MKIKELHEKVAEIIASCPKPDYRAHVPFKKEEFGVTISTIEKGVRVRRFWCPKCGSINLSSIKHDDKTKCSDCGHTFIALIQPYKIMFTQHFAEIIYADDETAIVRVCDSANATWKNPYNPNEPIEKSWDENPIVITGVQEPMFFVLSKEHGLRRFRNSQLSKASQLKRCYFLDDVEEPVWEKYCDICSTLGIRITDKNFSQHISDIIASAPSVTKPKKTVKSDLALAAAKEFIKDDASQEIQNLIKGFEFAFKYTPDEYIYWCPRCGKNEVVIPTETDLENNTIYCPSCGQSMSLHYGVASDARSSSTVNKLLVDKEGNLAVVKYHVSMQVSSDLKLEKEIVKEIVTVCLKNKTVSYGINPFTKELTKIGYATHYGKMVNPEEVDMDAFSKSHWGKRGILEFIKLYGRGYNQILEYIRKLEKNPIAEQIVKCSCKNLYKWIPDYSTASKDYNPKASNIRDAFGLSKSQAQIVINNDLSYGEMLHLKKLHSLDPSIEFEEFDWSRTNYCISGEGDNSFSKAVALSGQSIKTVKNYFCSCYYNQCIDWQEIPTFWLDYLRQMDTLKFDAKQKRKEMFSNSLKKSHDILNFAIRNVFDKEKAKIFDENVEEAKKFEYSFKNYFVKAPESAEDLVKEGVALNHSVAQHIECVANKDEYILFIRTKEEPEQSLYTVELRRSDKAIIQVRGNSNKLPKDEEIMEFINKWARFKKLNIVSF